MRRSFTSPIRTSVVKRCILRGLKFDRTVTEGEFYGLPRNEHPMELRRKNVLLIGDYLEEELRWLVGAFAIQLVVRNCIILTKTAERADSLRHYFSAQRLNNLHIFSAGANVEAAMDDLIRRFGHLDVVVSTPFDPLPLKPLAATDDWRGVLNEKDFEQLVETHITHHFRGTKGGVAGQVADCARYAQNLAQLIP